MASTSAVWPMFRPHTGSVNPRLRPIFGLRKPGRSPPKTFNFSGKLFERLNRKITSCNSLLKKNGILLMDSVPPAKTQCTSWAWILRAAVTTASSPEAQLRWTVKAGVVEGIPLKRLITRETLAASGGCETLPKITSSIKCTSRSSRSINSRVTIRPSSWALRSLNTVPILTNGVRIPLIMATRSIFWSQIQNPQFARCRGNWICFSRSQFKTDFSLPLPSLPQNGGGLGRGFRPQIQNSLFLGGGLQFQTFDQFRQRGKNDLVGSDLGG